MRFLNVWNFFLLQMIDIKSNTNYSFIFSHHGVASYESVSPTLISVPAAETLHYCPVTVVNLSPSSSLQTACARSVIVKLKLDLLLSARRRDLM